MSCIRSLLLLVAVIAVTLAAAAPSIKWRVPLVQGGVIGDPYYFMNPNGRVAVYSGVGNQSTVFVIATDTGSVLWQANVTTILGQYSGWCDGGQTFNGTANSFGLFCGTDRGIVAFDAETGSELWEFRTGIQNKFVPAHPTYVSGFVFFTFENGVNSSAAVMLNAVTGMPVWTSGENVAFTKIWRLGASHVVFCTYNNETLDVSIAAYTVPTVHMAWNESGLNFSAPGLWDNPNLDVDALGESVFVYEKPAIGTRTVSRLRGSDGTRVWQKEVLGHVADYDTYAFANAFYRLYTPPNSTGSFVVQKIHPNGQDAWTTSFSSTDDNTILLVGGREQVFTFGLSSNTVTAFNGTTGVGMWAYPVTSPTTGTLDSRGVLFLGSMGATTEFIALA